ncbi:MAG TPA: hypothetical protein VGQ83_13865 [Polyangia bacterium]|jgi:hypothetical protein
MGDHTFLDVTHVFFLEFIQKNLAQLGAAATTASLMQTAVDVAERFPVVDFASLDEFVEAIDDLRNPIARIEGRAEHLGGGLFALGRCPFAESVRNYRKVHGDIPALTAITDAFNQPSEATARYHVGHGAAVCAFCAIHQTLRGAVSGRITIGGRPVRVFQLGCKGADGSTSVADPFLAEVGVTRERLDQILREHVCCYAVLPS